MKGLRYLSLIFFIGLFLFPLALASDYQISIDAINTTVFPGEDATFKLTIANFDEFQQRFQVYTYNTEWVLRVDPPINIVPKKSQNIYTLYARPKTSVGYGTEGLTVLIKELNTKVISRQNIIVHVQDPNRRPGEYRPSVLLDAILPASIDPREPLGVTLNLRNRNSLNISEMIIVLDSELFSDSLKTGLEPLSEKSQEFTYTVLPNQASGNYPLHLSLIYRNETISQVTKTLRIKEIVDIVEEPTDTGILFKSVTSLFVTNDGNTPQTSEINLPTNWFRNLFSSTEPKATVKKEAGQRYNYWTVSLEPEESITLTHVENYRLLIIILILVVGGVITYYITRSPVIAVKETISLREEGEEGSSKLKVRLFIKNRTGKALNSVTLIDKVPSIAKYTQTDSLGIISPTKVVSSPKKGTVLKWELDILEPYEERILNYKLSSKLKIVGRLKLPSAKVQFATPNGKERVTFTKNVAYQE